MDNIDAEKHLCYKCIALETTHVKLHTCQAASQPFFYLANTLVGFGLSDRVQDQRGAVFGMGRY